jgi:hypothetical protein
MVIGWSGSLLESVIYLRLAASLAAISVLLYGFVWESS